MENTNTKSKKKSITLKTLLLALGLAVSVNSCSSCFGDMQEGTYIEDDSQNDNDDIDTELSTESNGNIENESSISSTEIMNTENSVLSTENTEANGNINSTEDVNDKDNDKKEELENHKHKYQKWSYHDDEQEARVCKKCGYTEYRKHSFKQKTKISYVSNNNATHKIIETKTCKTCDYKAEIETLENCGFNSWSYNKTSGLEERSCKDCGYTETKNHEHSVSSNLNYKFYKTNNDGTHKLKADYSCNVCGETMTSYKDVNCNLSAWSYNSSTGLEERNCNVCSYTETKNHEHTKAPANLIYTLDKSYSNGTHKLKATYNCSVCNEEIILYKDEACQYNSWSTNNGFNCIRECKICGYDDIKNHKFTVVPNSVTSNATVGLHNVLEKCNDCGYQKQVTVSCTGDGNRYFYQNGNVVTERENCAICGDVCIQDPHNHTYGNYIIVDDDQHKRLCACGNESFEAHSYSGWVVAGDGTNTRTCSSCNHTQTVTHTCSLKDHDEYPSSYTPDYCYHVVTTCEISGCTYLVRVPVSHNYHVESNIFGSIYTCYNCGYSYEQEASLTSIDSQQASYEEDKTKQLILK